MHGDTGNVVVINLKDGYESLGDPITEVEVEEMMNLIGRKSTKKVI